MDDDIEIGILVKSALPFAEIIHAQSVVDAKTRLTSDHFDLFLVDVNLPDGNGFELCQELRLSSVHGSTPIIFLTASGEKSEMIYGFSLGADDYVVKPFHGPELKVRVEARIRRQKAPSQVQKFDAFLFDLEFYRCQVVGPEATYDLNLTPTEFRVFYALIKAKGKVLSRTDLIKYLWEFCGVNIQERGIDSHVAHLRKKMGPWGNAISTLYGRGYTYIPQATPDVKGPEPRPQSP